MPGDAHLVPVHLVQREQVIDGSGRQPRPPRDRRPVAVRIRVDEHRRLIGAVGRRIDAREVAARDAQHRPGAVIRLCEEHRERPRAGRGEGLDLDGRTGDADGPAERDGDPAAHHAAPALLGQHPRPGHGGRDLRKPPPHVVLQQHPQLRPALRPLGRRLHRPAVPELQQRRQIGDGRHIREVRRPLARPLAPLLKPVQRHAQRPVHGPSSRRRPRRPPPPPRVPAPGTPLRRSLRPPRPAVKPLSEEPARGTGVEMGGRWP